MDDKSFVVGVNAGDDSPRWEDTLASLHDFTQAAKEEKDYELEKVLNSISAQFVSCQAERKEDKEKYQQISRNISKMVRDSVTIKDVAANITALLEEESLTTGKGLLLLNTSLTPLANMEGVERKIQSRLDTMSLENDKLKIRIKEILWGGIVVVLFIAIWILMGGGLPWN